jgi:hypothetical protein
VEKDSRTLASSSVALDVSEFTATNLVGGGTINPNPIFQDLGGLQGHEEFTGFNRPCKKCSTAWTMVGKPCKHYYARLRERNLGTKDYTVGKQSLRPLGNPPTGAVVHTTTVPTFFCEVTGKLIGPTDRSDRYAWRFRMKRANNE